jgi:hypothetical protein
VSGRNLSWNCGLIVLGLCVSACAPEQPGSSNQREVQARQGDLSKAGGTATVRKPYEQRLDDPATTNDESNDQPVGHYGTTTLIVSQEESGHTYTLDVEIEGSEVQRIYFPKGGWVDLRGCELDEDLTGDCVDENGRHWTFESAVEPRPIEPVQR